MEDAEDGRIQWARRCTSDLRASDAGQWSALRKWLLSKDISPSDAAIVDYGPDGSHAGYGLVVTRDGRVFDFTMQLGYTNEGEPLQRGDGYLTHWGELATGDLQGIYAQGAKMGQEILNEI